MMEIMHVAHATAQGGRTGYVETDDGVLKLKLGRPGDAAAVLGATNPEQLFACAYAACFGSALEFAAKQQGVILNYPEVRADIALDKDKRGLFISAALNVSLPGIEKTQAEELMKAAHKTCPYSRALRGTVEIISTILQSPLPSHNLIQPEYKEL